MIKTVKRGFSLAEILLTLTIVSLVLAATMPILTKSTNAPSEAPWKFVTLGDLAQNAAVYTVLGGSAVSVFGDKRVPIDSSVTANQAHVFAAKLNPKISIVARNHSGNNPLVSRHLIDFYEKAASGDDVTSIGKISFDNYYNMAVGKNALDNIETTSIANFTDAANASNTLWTVYKSSDDTDMKASFNTAVGQYAMGGDRKNVAYGGSSSTEYPTRNMSGAANTAVGTFALRRNTIGKFNTAVGAWALESNTNTNPGKGTYNTAIGALALWTNQTGNSNTAVGVSALRNNTTASYNTAVGVNALYANTTGGYNLAIGTNSLRYNTTGTNNIAVGTGALNKNTTGNNNLAVGFNALNSNKTGIENTALGYYTLFTSTTANYNTAVGHMSMRYTTTGINNTAVGYGSLYNNTTGNNNTAVGLHAMNSGAETSDNTAVGRDSMRYLSSGNDNVAIGVNSYRGPTTGTTGGWNTALGTSAMLNTTSGNYNTAIGHEALYYNASGNNNTAIGRQAGKNMADQNNKLYITANSSFIGTDSLIYGDDTTDARKLIFNVTGTNAYLGAESDDNKIITQSEMETYVSEHITYNDDMFNTKLALSDERLKNITGDNTSGLKEILQIKVKNYTMKNDKTKEPLVGVIAQELQKIFPNSVFEGKDGYLRIKRDEIFYACVNAIKELYSMFQDAVAKIAGLDEKIRLLEDKNKLNDEKIKLLEDIDRQNKEKITALKKQNKMFEERLTALENKKAKTADEKAQ